MKKSVRAKIHWVPPEKGGRMTLPAGKRYATVSCFKEDAERWSEEAWSIVLEFEEPPAKQGNPSIARAQFLMDTAPADRLQPGCAFDLYEGAKRVASVEIIE